MKRILAMVICVALLATMAITGSIAYLQDTDSTINTMVVGNVDIDQIEQQRKADDTLVDFDNDKPLYPAVYGNGTNSDGTTSRGEAQKGTDGFWTNVAGAQDKIVSVKNTGKSEAYVRTWFAFEADANNKLEYIDINWNEAVTPVLYTEEGNSYVTIDRNNYVVYCVTYPAPLAVGATSEKSLLQVHMMPEADNEYVAAFDETYDILVFTQAGQVENMSTDPKTALDFMFGAEHPWNDEDFKVETGRIVIRTANDLLALSGKTFTTDTKIVLANDIDMDGAELKTIHVGNHSYGAKVKFDGGNHTISNVKLIPGVDVDNSANGMENIGLFSLNCQAASELTVENLTLKKVTVSSSASNTYGAAAVVGYVNNGSSVTLKNVDIYNSTVANNSTQDGAHAAALVGYLAGDIESEVKLTDCDVIECTVAGNSQTNTGVGAFVGCANGSKATLTINDCINNARRGDSTAPDVGKIFGNATITGKGKQVITISTKEQLENFRNSVNNGNLYSGKTVMLTADIDLKNETWTPIGRQDTTGYFCGTFDGNGHTIKNLNVENMDNSTKNTTAGLFGWIDAAGATIKNLTIDNATVKGCHYTGAIAGYFSGTMENCTVKNSSIDSSKKDEHNSGDKAGAVIGYMNKNAEAVNCRAENCTVKAARDAGQVIGCCYDGTVKVTNCSAKNVVVTGHDNSTNNIKNEIVGRPQGATVTPAN